MNFESNIWKYDYGRYKVYVNKKSVSNKIIKISGGEIANRYYQKGKEVGWDITFSSGKLSDVKKVIREFKAK